MLEGQWIASPATWLRPAKRKYSIGEIPAEADVPVVLCAVVGVIEPASTSDYARAWVSVTLRESAISRREIGREGLKPDYAVNRAVRGFPPNLLRPITLSSPKSVGPPVRMAIERGAFRYHRQCELLARQTAA